MSKNTNNKKVTVAIAVVLVLIVLCVIINPFYTVQENKVAIITRIGQIIDVVDKPGLHVRVPLLDEVHGYSLRVMRIDGDAQKIPTKENQFIEVDTTSRWRIKDVTLFYKSLVSYEAALSKIADIIDSSTRDVISLYSFDSVVRSSNIINEINSNEELNIDGDDVDANLLVSAEKKTYVTISKGRNEIADDILTRANNQLSSLGIELIDVIFKGIKYADELQDAVFKRMITERNQIASSIRSSGEGKKAEILGKLQNEKQTILSESYAQAEEIKGNADAEAAAIYAQAYNKAPEFYNFWKSLESYKNTLPGIEKIMSTDSAFFNYITKP